MIEYLAIIKRKVLQINFKLAIKGFAVLFMMLNSMSAISGKFPKTDGELKVLPPYCKSLTVDGAGSASYKMWSKRIGSGFGHAHHYCAGLNTVNIANQEVNPNYKRNHLNSAVPEFEYMEKHAPRIVLMPEILTQKGKVLIRLNRGGEAILAFNKAIQIKKNYAPAYIALADYYISLNMKSDAKEVINTGLKWSPKSKGLKRRMEKIK